MIIEIIIKPQHDPMHIKTSSENLNFAYIKVLITIISLCFGNEFCSQTLLLPFMRHVAIL